MARIFVVEDDREVARGLVDALGVAGHEVQLAETGRDALQRLTAEDFDITIMDIRLPGISGIECFTAIRKTKPDIRVILMTGDSVETLVSEAAESSTFSILSSPFRLDEVPATLADIGPYGTMLITDDDPSLPCRLQHYLNAIGFRAHIANDDKAVDRNSLRVDCNLVIQQLDLASFSGSGLYLHLRHHRPPPPRIIITGKGLDMKDQIKQLQIMGCLGVLSKPFDLQRLINDIEIFLNEEDRQ